MIVMSRLIWNRCWLAATAALLFCSRVCFAQAPSGPFEFDFANTVSPLINVTGPFVSDLSIIGAGGTETPINISVDLTNAINGSLKSSGFSLLTVGSSDFVAMSYTASGRVSGGGLHPIRVILSIKMQGEGPVAGIETKVRVTLRYNLFFNSETSTLDGSCRGSAIFTSLGGSSAIRSDSISIPVPSGGDGSWHADMNILVLNRLGGGADITTSDGRVIPGILSGTFSAGSGRSSINVKGVNEGKGMTAHFILFNTDTGVEVDVARGKVLGQTIRF
jgi:hypothetical protein